MKTRHDPLAESLRAALDAEPLEAGDVGTSADDALLARAIDRAMGATASSPPASTGSVRSASGARKARLRLVRYALPAAAALVASIAMGAVYMSYRAKPAPSNDTTHTLQESAPPVATSPSAPPARVIAPAGDGAPTIDVDDLPSVAPQASVGAARSEGQHVAAPPTSTGTPAELFRDANASRRAGEVDKAVELYSALVARHADTPEALAARVSLGRLLLDRRGDAAGALVQFDAYLKSSSSDRALAEEARLGRALVFQRQGLQEEERRAWHELLERHPDSLYASRARERLRVLAPAAPAPAPSSSSP